MLLQDLFTLVPTDLTLFHEDHADRLNPQQLDPDFNPKYSKVVGTMDGREVWSSRFFPGHYVFAFRNGEDLQAYVIISEKEVNGAYPLTRMWSKGSRETVGMITALIVFIVRKLQHKIIITSDEPLTHYGWNWLIKSIKRGSLVAKDAKTGQPLTDEDIIQDKSKGVRTPLAVMLEGDKFISPIFGTGYRQISEMIIYIGHKDLI